MIIINDTLLKNHEGYFNDLLTLTACGFWFSVPD
ncbi:hypothetical protein ALT761_04101 [Alteromonas sp. 76-1]|nr:hypothetical protein ALT761_04101 [Alteromonas sp. 76-1]